MFSKTIFNTILAAAASFVAAIPTANSNEMNAVSARDGSSFSAKMTWYNAGLGACGQVHSDHDLVVADDRPVYGTWDNPNNAPVCQKRMRVYYAGRSIDLEVVDMGPSCPPNGLDLTPAAWRQLVGSTDLGPQQGTWDWL